MKRALERIAGLIREGDSFLITSHVDPDGDSVASQLALAAVLTRLGKRGIVVNQDPLPKAYAFLPNSEMVLSKLPPQSSFRAVFILDSPNLERLGETLLPLLTEKLLINIDHHSSNSGFGDHNLVVPEASSTSELIYDVTRLLGVELYPEIAIVLLTGICADTGGLKQANTSVKTIGVVGHLMESGGALSTVMNRLYEENPPSRMRLLGLVLRSLELHDGILVLTLTQRMLEEAGSSLEESENFAEYSLSVRGVKVGILVREREDGVVRVSLRSREPIDVDRIASLFGGGGHPQAAGCQLKGGVNQVTKRVVAAVRKAVG